MPNSWSIQQCHDGNSDDNDDIMMRNCILIIEMQHFIHTDQVVKGSDIKGMVVKISILPRILVLSQVGLNDG